MMRSLTVARETPIPVTEAVPVPVILVSLDFGKNGINIPLSEITPEISCLVADWKRLWMLGETGALPSNEPFSPAVQESTVVTQGAEVAAVSVSASEVRRFINDAARLKWAFETGYPVIACISKEKAQRSGIGLLNWPAFYTTSDSFSHSKISFVPVLCMNNAQTIEYNHSTVIVDAGRQILFLSSSVYRNPNNRHFPDMNERTVDYRHIGFRAFLFPEIQERDMYKFHDVRFGKLPSWLLACCMFGWKGVRLMPYEFSNPACIEFRLPPYDKSVTAGSLMGMLLDADTEGVFRDGIYENNNERNFKITALTDMEDEYRFFIVDNQVVAGTPLWPSDVTPVVPSGGYPFRPYVYCLSSGKIIYNPARTEEYRVAVQAFVSEIAGVLKGVNETYILDVGKDRHSGKLISLPVVCSRYSVRKPVHYGFDVFAARIADVMNPVLELGEKEVQAIQLINTFCDFGFETEIVRNSVS